MVDDEGNRVKFHVTTDSAHTAYYFVEGKRTAWEAEGFYWLENWLRERGDAPGAEADAEKGHAAEQRSGKKATQAEKGHAADQPLGEKAAQADKGHAGDKATQGSGGRTQTLWSEPEPVRKKAPHSSMGQPIVGDESDMDIVEEWSEESDTIAHRIRVGRCRERTSESDPVERQKAREEARRRMQARKAEDKKIFDGVKRRYKRQAAENEADLMAWIWETEREQVVRLSARCVERRQCSRPIGRAEESAAAKLKHRLGRSSGKAANAPEPVGSPEARRLAACRAGRAAARLSAGIPQPPG